jgi:hypothetical protein
MAGVKPTSRVRPSKPGRGVAPRRVSPNWTPEALEDWHRLAKDHRRRERMREHLEVPNLLSLGCLAIGLHWGDPGSAAGGLLTRLVLHIANSWHYGRKLEAKRRSFIERHGFDPLVECPRTKATKGPG